MSRNPDKNPGQPTDIKIKDAAKEEDPRDKQTWYKPDEIASAAYQSLDEQIKVLRQIPLRVEAEAKDLFDLLHTEGKDILCIKADIKAFREKISALNKEVGLTWHILLKMDRDQNKSLSAPQQIQFPQLPGATPRSGSPQLPAVAGQPIFIKHGFGAAFWEHRTQNRWAKAFEHAVDVQRQPEITTSNVKDVRSYGEELQAEWALTLDFHYKATILVRYRKDEPTHRLLLEELTEHCLKLGNITCAFTTTLTELRTDEFGDRKVGVAGGAMYLQAMQAMAEGRLSIGDYYKKQREIMGAQDVGEK